MNLKNTTKYDDILYLPHPVSKNHPQMPLADRAAQFSPFAALTGHETAIKETARLTDERIELDDNRKSILNEKLQLILERISHYPMVRVTYFQPDSKKDGGAYLTVSGNLKKLDEYNRLLVMAEGVQIPIDEIYELEFEEDIDEE